MVEAALYILTGVALYGGAHELYRAAGRAAHPHVLLAVMYLLLAGFAVSSLFAHQAQSFASLVVLGKLSVLSGMLLWAALGWLIAALTGCGARLTPAALSAAWAVLLIANISTPYSLMYADITPISAALAAGPTRLSWHTSPSPWWSAVKVTALATLAWSGFAAYRRLRRDESGAAPALAFGLSVLGATALADLLIGAHLIRSAWLSPYGFLVLLLVCSLAPKRSAGGGALCAASWVREPAGRQPPALERAGLVVETAPAAPDRAPALNQAHAAAGLLPLLEPRALPMPVPRQAAAVAVGDRCAPAAPIERPAAARAPLSPPVAVASDDAVLRQVSGNLIDIAVQATLLGRRLADGRLDPAAAGTLCERIRRRALATRRLAHRLGRVHEAAGGEQPRDD